MAEEKRLKLEGLNISKSYCAGQDYTGSISVNCKSALTGRDDKITISLTEEQCEMLIMKVANEMIQPIDAGVLAMNNTLEDMIAKRKEREREAQEKFDKEQAAQDMSDHEARVEEEENNETPDSNDSS